MATSGVYTFELTARDIVTQALREIKVIPAGGQPDASEMSDGILALNGMLKSWQTEDSLWREAQDTIVAPAGNPSVALAPSTRNVTDVRMQVDPGYQRPMQMWQRADYMQVPNKTVTGQPLCFYFSQQRGTAELFLWPIPSVDTTLLVDSIQGIQTVTDPGQTVDVPDDWQEAVWTNLAVRMGHSYGAELSQELIARAGRTYQTLLDMDRPESYFMGPWDDRYYG